jgi:mannose/cellobiose epimerase-like protein (N-acyl-D-glucosamine 2-epimerase family)
MPFINLRPRGTSWQLACVLVLLLGCNQKLDAGDYVDAAWHRKDLDSHLTRWLALAPTASGLLLGQFDRHWQAAAQPVGDLTIQSRLIYTLIAGYEANGEQRYLDAARRGADFLLQYFHDPQLGGFYQRVDPVSFKVMVDTKNTYGQAFALLALSHMARVTGEARYRQAALEAWRAIKLLRDVDGGFRPEAARDFSSGAGLRTQNPVMHIFEALLALLDATNDSAVLADTESVGNFVLYKLLVGLPSGGAYIPEWYDQHWQPLASKEAGGYIDFGHQFEWSHLLRSAERRGLPPLYGEVADRLLKYAVANGYDDSEGGVFNRAFPDGSVDRYKYWWPQAEALRAFLAAGTRPDMARRYRQTLDLVEQELVDHTNGGWLFGDKQTCLAGLCGSQQPEPYHLVGMDLAALALSKDGLCGARHAPCGKPPP